MSHNLSPADVPLKECLEGALEHLREVKIALMRSGCGYPIDLDRTLEYHVQQTGITPTQTLPPNGMVAALNKPEASPSFDLIAHLHRQRAFSERTFGPGARTAGVLDHIRKELAEIEADPADLAEWVDVILLAMDGAWRHGWEPADIAAAIAAKQTKNEGRTWPDWRTAPQGKAIEHDRSGEAKPDPIENRKTQP